MPLGGMETSNANENASIRALNQQWLFTLLDK
jgi:hypothetical protein